MRLTLIPITNHETTEWQQINWESIYKAEANMFFVVAKLKVVCNSLTLEVFSPILVVML